MALLIGLLVGNLAHPGSGFNIDPKTLDARAVAGIRGQAKAQNITDFLVHIIPNTVVDALAKEIFCRSCSCRYSSVFALSIAVTLQPLLDVMDSLTRAVFGVGSDPHALRPDWRFWRDGFHHWKVRAGFVGPSGKINRHALHHVHLFRGGGAGLIARLAGFGILKFLWFIREEILLVLATSSSSPLPNLMAKLQRLGCSKASSAWWFQPVTHSTRTAQACT